MGSPEHPSRFAALSAGRAWAVVLATAAATAVCLASSLTHETLPLPSPRADQESTEGPATDTDVDFYRHVIERVHAGQGYYDAVADEFKDWEYQPSSLFNWRTPVYAWVIGKLPEPVWAKIILVALSLATAMLAYAVVENDLDKRFAFLLVLLIGPLAWSVLGDIYVFTELWAGVFIALSVCAYALGRWPWGVAAALAALFFRELALPYCLLALTLAVWRQRPREILAWVAGLALYAGFLAFHAAEVARHTAGTSAVQAAGWVRFGGLPFVIGTTQMNVLLIRAPAWVAAATLPLSILGLGGWRGETGLRVTATVTGYLLTFAVIGLPNNAYWGLLVTPLIALGWVALPPAVRDLYRAISREPAIK